MTADEEDDAEEEEEEEGEERERKSFTYESLPFERLETRRNGVPLRSAWIPASAANEGNGLSSLSFLPSSFFHFFFYSSLLSFSYSLLSSREGRSHPPQDAWGDRRKFHLTPWTSDGCTSAISLHR